MIRAHADLAVDFKRCCMLTGDFGGSDRAGQKVPGIAALCGAIVLVGCTDMPPPLAYDLPEGAYAATAAFDQRVKSRFPVGSDDGALRAELVRERFVIRTSGDSPATFTATYEHGDSTCRVDWTIQWREDAGMIADIGAKYWPTCL
jgi:hypothetical protein